MSHEVYLVRNGKQTLLPVGNLSWSSSLDTLGAQLDFDLAENRGGIFPYTETAPGDGIMLRHNQRTLFQGVIITETRNGRHNRSFHCLDPAFYLNQSKLTIKFKGERADDAIRKVLTSDQRQFPIGSIAAIKNPINKIYTGQALAEIIKDILAQAQGEYEEKYRMEMREGKLYIEERSKLKIAPMIKLADHVSPIPIMETLSDPSRTLSIEEMKNSVIVTAQEKVLATAKDDQSVKQYGLLQEYISIEKENKAEAEKKARYYLKEQSKVKDELSFTVVGHDDLCAGRLIDIVDDSTGAKGTFVILSASHTVSNGIHKTQLKTKLA
ncbi:XkdQ/YqbQ family protein [Brevibacillus dissolubilis]|uniref:XkdQ/YqbQ family protein n=1 Tax=Brevibacillus dissolubilis TaxID=1844116 RepID=UPI001117A6B9|nr:hypothetical protein [Brevibacillus dissolubilis]